jgi:ubiquinone/menaquinone biosynthesis C-methylase UbiE
MAWPIQLPPSKAYERWADCYDVTSNPLLTLEERCIGPLLHDVKGQSLIDVGCGTGHHLQTLVAAGARAVGVDLTQAMLSHAAAKPGAMGRCAQADALRLPFEGGVADIVLGSLLVGYVSDVSALFTELVRVARPGGCVLLSELHPEAVRSGWRRTFRVAGQLYEPQYTAHSIDSVQDAAKSTGALELVAMSDHCFEEPERAVFENAGKTNFDKLQGTLALWIGLWRVSV